MNPVEFLTNFSVDTWSRLEINNRFGYQPDERVFTGNLITDFLRTSPECISIIPIPQKKEKISGADIDLWVHYSKFWVRYLIQAKVFNFKYKGYVKLDHKVKNVFQIKTLIDFSGQVKAIPLVGFYNYFVDFPARKNVCMFPNEYKEIYGFSVTDAKEVFATFGSRGYKKARLIHSRKATIPAKCLLCCPLIIRPSLNGPENPSVPPLFSPINILKYKDLFLQENDVPSPIRAVLTKDLISLNEEVVFSIYKGHDFGRPKILVCIDNNRIEA